MRQISFAIFTFLYCLTLCHGQNDGFIIQNEKKETKVRFKLINNLIIFPLDINGVELSFLLDTGVSKPMIFNILNMSDSLNIKNTETILLRGLGEGESVEALKSEENIIKIGDAIKFNQDLYAIYDSRLNFAPKLGVPVNGIIGYDILKDFVVEINYSRRYLKFYDPKVYSAKHCNKCEVLNLEFHNNKPFIEGNVKIDENTIPVKLLIDSGGSDAVWLFEDAKLGIKSGNNFFDDFLGHGLSGSVYGKRSKLEEFAINNFKFKAVNVAYPDSSSISYKRVLKGRNGSVAGEILKRFNITFDYQNAKITFKKNGNFHRKFYYNKTGIVLEYGGYRLIREKDNRSYKVTYGNNFRASSSKIVLNTNYRTIFKPAYTIVELRDNSPAKKAGLMIGDIILKVNERPTENFTLQQITQMFYGESGKWMRLVVERKGMLYEYSFIMQDLLQKKPEY